MIDYLKEKRSLVVIGILVLGFINVYFIYLCGSRLYLNDLIYLDVILIFIGIVILGLGKLKYQEVNKLQQQNKIIKSYELKEYLSRQSLSIIEQNDRYYREEINHLSTQMQELADYISRWSHEVKLPVASMRLMNERNQDLALKKQMRLTIEQIQLLLNTMLMSSKLRNPENDIKMEKVFLAQVIKEAIKHQSYFLINDHFTIKLDIGNEYVYSDRRWLTYMLDQFITNSIKYKQNDPKLTFLIKQAEGELTVIIEDNGIGIAQVDSPYIFDRGFIGHNLRDGDYRSTGMGLYFVKEIANKLGVEVIFDNDFHQGSRFMLKFKDNAEYFMLDY